MKAIAVLALILAVVAPARAQDSLRVGEVTVQSVDVFSPREQEQGWIYRAAAALHMETRESIIRKFLLFHEGEPYDSVRLAETERNLRALAFVKSARVSAAAPRDGRVDVTVRTQDTWTTEPQVSVGRGGGVTTWGVALQENDLLGTGRRLAFTFDKGAERTRRFFEYEDPYLFGPYWKADLLYGDNSDGDEAAVTVGRPFAALSSRGALVGNWARTRRHETLYAPGGGAVAAFRQDHQDWSLAAGRGLPVSTTTAWRLSGGLLAVDDRFSARPGRAGDPRPDDRHFRTLFTAVEFLHSRYAKLNYVNQHSRYEDFLLGPRAELALGVSPAALAADPTTGYSRIEGSVGAALGRDGILRAGSTLESRWRGGPRNMLLAAQVDAVRGFRRPLTTFVARLRFDGGWARDGDVQFFADGATGLRGYRLHEDPGGAAVILNLEQRFFTGGEMFNVLSPGAAVFFDTGTAAPSARGLRLTQVHSDLGAGIRLGLPRAPSHTLFRIDFAWPLSPDTAGRRDVLISFSSSQAF